jgi:hypothetical protein
MADAEPPEANFSMLERFQFASLARGTVET